MATRQELNDKKLIRLLAKLSRRWRTRFDALEDKEAAKLGRLFTSYEQDRRLKLLSFLDMLQVDETGTIIDNTKNQETALKAMQELKKLQFDRFGRKSSFGKWVDRNYEKASKMGVLKAKDSYNIGEGKRLPPGYTPPTARLVQRTKKMTFMHITRRNAMDLDIVQQSFLRHIFDPTATVQSLRRDLVERGQIEGMVDTIGRRITASERADRIAKYELADLAQQSQIETVNDIYNDGEPNPDDFYFWQATLDGREGEDSRERHGQVLTMKQWKKKQFSKFSGKIAPLRPRDRCDMIHVRPEWFSPRLRKRYFNAGITPPIQGELVA
jgi:hypothetical protein